MDPSLLLRQIRSISIICRLVSLLTNTEDFFAGSPMEPCYDFYLLHVWSSFRKYRRDRNSIEFSRERVMPRLSSCHHIPIYCSMSWRQKPLVALRIIVFMAAKNYLLSDLWHVEIRLMHTRVSFISKIMPTESKSVNLSILPVLVRVKVSLESN